MALTRRDISIYSANTEPHNPTAGQQNQTNYQNYVPWPKTHTESHKYRRSSVGGKEIKAYFYSTGKSIVGPRLPLHKVDCFQQHCLFISVEHPHLSPFVKPRNILNLAIQNIFFVQSYVESAFTHNLGSAKKLVMALLKLSLLHLHFINTTAHHLVYYYKPSSTYFFYQRAQWT